MDELTTVAKSAAVRRPLDLENITSRVRRVEDEFQTAEAATSERAPPTKELLRLLTANGALPSARDEYSNKEQDATPVDNPIVLQRSQTLAMNDRLSRTADTDEYARLARRLYSRQMAPNLDIQPEL